MGASEPHPAQQSLKLEIQDAIAPPVKKRSKRSPPSVRIDPVPAPGSVEHDLYTIILHDTELRPIVAGPGDFVIRLVRMFPELDAADLKRGLHSAGLYLAEGTRRPIKNGRRFLENQFESIVRWKANHARPAPPTVVVNTAGGGGRPKRVGEAPEVVDPLRRKTG